MSSTSVASNPNVAVFVRMLQTEKDMDKDKHGSAILVRVDRVRAGPNDIRRR